MSNDWENILKKRLDEKSSGTSSRHSRVSTRSSGNGTSGGNGVSKGNGISKVNGNGNGKANGNGKVNGNGNGTTRDSVRLSDLAPPDDLTDQIHGSTQLLSDEGVTTVDASQDDILGNDVQLIVEIEELKVRLEASEAARLQADRRISELEIDLQKAQRELASAPQGGGNSEMMAAHVIEIQELDQEILRLRDELNRAKTATPSAPPPPPSVDTAELERLRADLAQAHGIIRTIEEAYLIGEGLMDPSDRS